MTHLRQDGLVLLLRFRFENHASFRDECSLTLVQDRLRTTSPSDGTWIDYTNKVAAIYGPNASGKSTVLDALLFMTTFVELSGRAKRRYKRNRRTPFGLDHESRERPSTYVLDFVVDDVRYEYGFAISDKSVLEEWLYDFPTSRRRVLFERGLGSDSLAVGRGLKGGELALQRATGDDELVLSKGAILKNPQLEHLWDAIVNGVVVTKFGETNRTGRLQAVISDIVDGTFSIEDLQLMLKVADVGIASAELAEREENPETARMFRAILKETRRAPASAEEESADITDEMVEQALKDFNRILKFQHVGDGHGLYQLPMESQSTGTLTWLSLAAPAIKALRAGTVFAVDEIDASLHPQLAQVMIQMFEDREINSRGAQLIFTTHDTYFISPTASTGLRPEEVFFVEKDIQGRSHLFSLGDFPVRRDQNFSRRYLQGRYGAVPLVAPSFLSSLVESKVEASDAGQKSFTQAAP